MSAEHLKILARVNEALTLQDAAQGFVDLVAILDPSVASVAIYLYSRSGSKLSPLANAHLHYGKTKFYVSRDMLRDAIRSRTVMTKSLNKINGDLTIRAFAAELNADEDFVIHWESTASAPDGCPPVDEMYGLIEPKLQLIALLHGMDDWVLQMARTMNAAIEAKDTYTSGHSDRVSRYAMALAAETGMADQQKQLLLISSICHDVGKIGVRDEILKKPGFLSTEEFDEMKAHPEMGADIIQHTPNADLIMDGVKYHHEKFDGAGYPYGLVGEGIPLFGRIVAIADAFDAMTSGRSYSGFMQQDEAIEELLGKDDLFDPGLLMAFSSAFAKGKLTMRTGTMIGVPGGDAHTQIHKTRIR